MKQSYASEKASPVIKQINLQSYTTKVRGKKQIAEKMEVMFLRFSTMYGRICKTDLWD